MQAEAQYQMLMAQELDELDLDLMWASLLIRLVAHVHVTSQHTAAAYHQMLMSQHELDTLDVMNLNASFFAARSTCWCASSFWSHALPGHMHFLTPCHTAAHCSSLTTRCWSHCVSWPRLIWSLASHSIAAQSMHADPGCLSAQDSARHWCCGMSITHILQCDLVQPFPSLKPACQLPHDAWSCARLQIKGPGVLYITPAYPCGETTCTVTHQAARWGPLWSIPFMSFSASLLYI